MGYRYALTYTLQRKPYDDKPLLKSKVCSECKIEKPLKEFANHMLGVAGVTSCCKKCLNARGKKLAQKKKRKKKAFAVQ